MHLLFNALSLRNGPSGTRTRLCGLVPALLARGDVAIAIVHQPGVEFPTLADGVNGLRLIARECPSAPWRRARREGRILRRLQKELGSDFVFSDTLPLPDLPGLVTTVHDLRHREGQGALRLGFRRLLEGGLRRSAAIHCVSRSIADELSGYLPGMKVDVVPNGVDRHVFSPDAEAADAEVLSRHGVVGNYLLSVGHFEDRKDPGLALRLRAALWQKQIPLDLVLVGGGAGLPERGFTALYGLSGGHHCGKVLRAVPDADLPALFRNAWAFLAPSKLEGFGLAPLEAMACGSVVIATSIPAHREVLGQAALYAPVGDTEAFLRHIIDLRHDGVLRTQLIMRGLDRAPLFSWDVAARQLRESLDRVNASQKA